MSTMNRKAIMGAIPMVVSAIANGANVQVVWGDFQTASTTGKSINMPKLPLEDSKVEAYALGFAVHETGHIVGTDFSVPVGKGLRRSLINVLEDARIERERMKSLPGSRRWLENLANVLVEDGLIRSVGEEAEIGDKLISYFLSNLWLNLFQFTGLKDVAVKSRIVLEGALPPEVIEALDSLALTVKSTTSTGEVAGLADEIISLLEQIRDEQSEQDDSQGGNDPNDRTQLNTDDPANAASSESDANSENAAQSQDQDGSQSTGNDSDAAKSNESDHDPEMGNGDQAGNTRNGAGQDSVDDVKSQSISSPHFTPNQIKTVIEQLLGSEEIEAGEDRAEMIVRGLREAMSSNRQAGNLEKQMEAPRVAEMQSKADGRSLISSVRLQSMALRSRLDEYVQVQTRRRQSSARSGSRLVRDAAGRLAMGDTRIFSVQKSQARVVDTAICLLIDCSQSMDGRRVIVDKPIDVAKNAAVALAVALEEIRGIQLSVIGFGTPVAPITRVMKFGESIRQTAGRIDSLIASGSTPLAEALMVAHTDLLSVDAQRRIALVITDGEPDDASAVAAIVKFGRKYGIEHMGVGIKQPTQHLFPASCLINDVKQLPAAVISMVQQALFDNRIAA
jgi:Mg-chelatase subunit ChlD